MSSPGNLIPDPDAIKKFRVGQCVVDSALREIRVPGAKRAVRVTPKALAVLLVLVEQAGKVVSRDVLMDRVWSDTMPTNDVVTQAITLLRKAFGERRGDPRYIETIAKTGYRLVAPVEEMTQSAVVEKDVIRAQPANESSPLKATETSAIADAPATFWHARTKSIALLLVAVLCVVMAVLVGIVRREAKPAVVLSHGASAKPYRLITSTTGFEISPALSPDGSQVAYVSVESTKSESARILVQATDPSQPRPLTYPSPGVWDSAPMWSPNGKDIAFLRRVPGSECRVMLISSNGGNERELATCDASETPSFDWSPDGASLVFSSSAEVRGSHGLRRLDLLSGQWTPLVYGADARDVDYLPRHSPDGKWIAFMRGIPLGDLWRVPAKGGSAERLTHEHGELRGLSWTPDGKAIVFGKRIDGQTRLFRLQLDNRQIHDFGLEDAQSPSIASAASRLAFMQRKPRFGIYRIPLDAESGSTEQLFASSGRDILPAVSPDGTQLLFASDRSGDFGLWWANLEREESLRLIEGIHPRSDHAPVWSQDGKRALVSGFDAMGRHVLFEVQPGGGQVDLLDLPIKVDSFVSAAYVPNPDQLLVIVAASKGASQLLLLERAGKDWRTLTRLEGVSVAKVDWSQDRVLFTRAGEKGLWQSDMALAQGSITSVNSQYPARTRQRNWTVMENGQVEYMQHLSECSVSVRHIGRGRSQPDVRCLEPYLRAANNGFSASARNRAIYLSLATDDGANIAFMPLPEPVK